MSEPLTRTERIKARYFDEDDPWAKGRALDDRRYSIDHFFAKLLGLRHTMRTAAGRAEAERRKFNDWDSIEFFLDHDNSYHCHLRIDDSVAASIGLSRDESGFMRPSGADPTLSLRVS